VESDEWMSELMAGFVTSADTGNEDLVIASRDALVEYCNESQEHLNRISNTLIANLKQRQGEDRIIVPTLEIIAFLFYAGIFARSTQVDYRKLCLYVQQAGYKTGNVRKLEACVKVYGAIANISISPILAGDENRRAAGAQEARKRLGALLLHPWPRIRSLVVDELWGLALASTEDDEGTTSKGLLGVDWGKANKADIQKLITELEAK